METGENGGQKMHTGIIAWLPEIGIAFLLGIGFLIANKYFHFFGGKTESDKLNEAEKTKETASAIELNTTTKLQPIKFSDFSKTGVGTAELKNQFPYTPAQVTDMVTQIYKDKTFLPGTYSDGTNSIAVINSLPSKFSLPLLSIAFNAAYGQDLQTFFKTNLHNDAEATINNSIGLKPDFIKLLPASQALLTKNNQKLIL